MIRSMLAATALLLATPALAQNQATPGPAPKVTYIQAGTLLDQPGKAPRGNSTIIVRDGKIAEIRDGFVAPEAGATLVDLRDRFVLPGLIDLHVHLFNEGDPLKARLAALSRDEQDEFVIGALRDAIDRGAVEGPSIVNAGEMISISGGHGDDTNGLAEPWADAVAAKQVNNCNGADD